MKKPLLFTIAFTLSIGLLAQTPDRKWGVGIKGGSQQYNGDIGNGFYKFDQALYAFGGISISRNLSEKLDFYISATTGDLGYVDNADRKFLSKMSQFNFNLKLNMFKYDEHTLRPFINAGIGYMKFEDRVVKNNMPIRPTIAKEFENMILPNLGLGITVKLSPVVNLVLEETYLRSDYDAIDNHAKNSNDVYLQHSLGIVFNIGKAKDTDKDGVSDKKDLCPDVAGLAQFDGCPDTDGDGIIDSKDNCPKTKGLEAFGGCPDTDGDGVPDKSDQCPKTKGLKALGGCPDSDGDGVSDKSDDCPNEKGSKALRGCPDSDGDGVADKYDECPNEKGIKALKGCPKKEEEKSPLVKNTTLYTVYFDHANTTVKKTHLNELDNIVKTLKKYPDSKVEINGHADSVGDENMNLKLSKNRAKIVMNYLVNQGISKKRLMVNGFGESKPIANNNTKEGRAKNRRAELILK